ncbi:MAG: PfkB family carbohydrate kinase [Janthinobacterium lividum]
MASPAAIVCIGELLWDILPTGRQPGGAPFQAARYLRQLGQSAQLISRVGDDELGRELLTYGTHLGLDERLIQRSRTHLTGVAKATAVAASQQVAYHVVEPVAWDYLQYTAEAQAAVQQARMVVYGSLAARRPATRETLYRLLLHAPFKVFDVNLRPPHYRREVVKYLLRQADFVKLSSEELTEIMGWLGQPTAEATALPWLAGHFGLQALCLTKGPAGATLWMDNQFFHHAGFPAAGPPVLSSNDAFLAALLTGLLAHRPPADCLQRACAAGALAAQAAGYAEPALTEQAITDLSASWAGLAAA